MIEIVEFPRASVIALERLILLYGFPMPPAYREIVEINSRRKQATAGVPAFVRPTPNDLLPVQGVVWDARFHAIQEWEEIFSVECHSRMGRNLRRREEGWEYIQTTRRVIE